MEINEQLEELAMSIISNSGAARSNAFQALSAAKKGDFDEADALMKEASVMLGEAHKSHRRLLMLDARGELSKVSILLTHAQDHLMTGTLAQELIAEIILLHKQRKENTEEEK